MSTRCHIVWRDEPVNTFSTGRMKADTLFKGAVAAIYKHSDGYPHVEDYPDAGVFANITPWLKEYRVARGWDPEYEAAFVLTKLKLESTANMGKFNQAAGLSTIGQGICMRSHCDIAYLYVVYCSSIVCYERVDSSNWNTVYVKHLETRELPNEKDK